MASLVTCVAPVNIAVIKYWGKRDENLILPLNDSISATLSLNYMFAKTSIAVSPDFKENKFWLNGKEENFENPRLENCLAEIKKRAKPSNPDMLKWKIHICSENNFPTAAGLASSAAGYACLVVTLGTLFGVQGDLSSIARMGSGSACRSVYGGWVQWHKGVLGDGSDSIATQIAPQNHWPEMRILILVVNDERKKYSSTSGMRNTVKTSSLIHHRVENCVSKHVDSMIKAIKTRDFQKFSEITMKDSNQFHAVCLDTSPPIFYLNQVSQAIIDTVHYYNNYHQTNKVAYTFDAGPNACLYLLEKDVPEVISLINAVFPPSNETVEYIKGSPISEVPPLEDDLMKNLVRQRAGLIKYIIHTNVGEGPKVLKGEDCHLLNEVGFPKKLLS